MGRAEPRLCVLLVSARSGLEATPLFGLTPAQRTALAFQRAGVRDFLVVGPREPAERVAASLRGLPWRGAASRRARVRAAESPMLASFRPDERFFVARTDTHYDRRLLVRFVEGTAEACDAVIALDRRADALATHADAARACLWGGGPGAAVRTVGRGLAFADGVVTGLALGTPGLARALAEAGGDLDALDHALGALVAREPVQAFPVAELWQDVRCEGDWLVARRKVLAGAVGVADGVIARRLNRPLSRRITERLLGHDVKPWQISLSVFLLTLAAGLSFALGYAPAGGLLAQTASILDGVDGELARVRYQDSPFGGVYDAILDRVGDAALIGGMTLYAWAGGAGRFAVALGFAAVAGSSLSMLVKEKYGTQFLQTWGDERDGRLRWLLLGRDGRMFLALVAGVTGLVEPVLAYLAIGTHLHAAFRIYRIRSEAARA